MAARLPHGEHILAGDSNHWIMQERPDLVVGAIEKVFGSYSESAVSAAANKETKAARGAERSRPC
jgi:hypothetical protein